MSSKRIRGRRNTADPSATQDPSGDELTSAPPAVTGLMSADAARSVRFQISSPQGYFFPQVEHFVAEAADTIDKLDTAVRQRDDHIALLNAELAHSNSDVSRLRTEIELFKVQGAPLVDADGSYVTESQLATAQKDRERIAELEQQLTRVSGEYAQAVQALRDLGLANQQQSAQLADQTATIAEMSQRVHDLEAREAALAAVEPADVEPDSDYPLPRGDEEVVAHRPDPDTANTRESTDQVAPKHADQEQKLLTLEDTYIPSEQSPIFDYNPAQPGAPLSTPGVPLPQWAPELHGRSNADASEADAHADSEPDERRVTASADAPSPFDETGVNFDPSQSDPAAPGGSPEWGDPGAATPQDDGTPVVRLQSRQM